MEGNRFDEITRDLARGTSRRRALKSLVASIGGAVFALSGLDRASARRRCRVYNQICRKPGDCCDFFCGPPDQYYRQRCGVCPDFGYPCGTGECCNEGQTCIDGACCDNPCGSRDDQFCCGDQSCVSHFTEDTGFVYSCCDPSLTCNDNTICCASGETCLTQSVCCAEADICNGNECCTGGTVCTTSGCCETPCEAGGTVYCCLEGGQCDLNGCLGG